MKKNTKPCLVPLAPETWGFQAIKPLAEIRLEKIVLGTIYQTYLNDPVLTPGRPLWAYARSGTGGWTLTSTRSEAEIARLALALESQKAR